MLTLRQENKGLYWAWKAMKQRCQNPRCHAYKNYGARGITVCEEWQRFEPFCEWALQNGYQKGLELDRKENDGPYCPDNCRWSTRRENTNNRRNTIWIEVDGERLPETVWAEKLGVDRALLKYWIRSNGMQYAVERIRGILKDGYTPRDFAYGHGYPVRHVESGQVFPSVKAAARHFEIGPGVLTRAIRNDRPTGKGRFTWEEIQ